MSRNLIRNLFIFLLIAVNVGCDQISKSVVRGSVDYYEQIELVADNFILTKVENSGAFMGLGESLPLFAKHLLFLALPVIVLLFVLGFILMKRNLDPYIVTGLCFVIGGGMGNTFDRFVYGSVTDFLHLDFGIFRTGIFNMADMSIMIGMALILDAQWSRKPEIRAD